MKLISMNLIRSNTPLFYKVVRQFAGTRYSGIDRKLAKEYSSSEGEKPPADKMTDGSGSDSGSPSFSSEEEEKQPAASPKETRKRRRKEAGFLALKKDKFDDFSENKHIVPGLASGVNDDEMRESRDPKTIGVNSVLPSSVVIQAKGTFSHRDMPFVNRHEELSQVFFGECRKHQPNHP
eukprot:Rmarinus@m.12245